MPTKKKPRVFTEERPIKRAPAGKQRVVVTPEWGFEYTTAAGPCPSQRASCPVQLFFDRGTPKLRFCRVQPNKKKRLKPGEKPKYTKAKAPKQKGFTVEVSNGAEAQRIAAAACRCWKNSPDGFTQVVERAKGKPAEIWRGSFETCAIGPHAPGTAPLGKTKKRKRRRKPSGSS